MTFPHTPCPTCDRDPCPVWCIWTGECQQACRCDRCVDSEERGKRARAAQVPAKGMTQPKLI